MRRYRYGIVVSRDSFIRYGERAEEGKEREMVNEYSDSDGILLLGRVYLLVSSWF